MSYNIYHQQMPYFLTFQVVNWVDIFTRKRYRDILVENLNYCTRNKGLNIHAWVIMSNHVHCILSTENNLSDILRDLKSYTCKLLIESIINEPESRRDWMLFQFRAQARTHNQNKYYQIWTHENHAIELNETILLEQRLNYLHENPVRAGYVEEPHHYVYSSAMDYAGNKGLIDILRIE